ncbi:NAD(P)-binding protein [Coniochaeta ligniaria NRRL 30616]|uniref:NAD(P)-binding protein n=1 Tax=Coniochaeta ligniaria NRRL 30616 TaxID=1408157 RepID=A0A1J7J7M6_9PEZI|nr:NAD(P)-binding protein [Coniochaeta ligniaria NRRL 30616]
MPFPYKNVLITGASSGIGQALAERIIDSGAFVIAVGRRQDRLDALVAKFGSDKVAAEVFDVSDIEAIPEWAKKMTTTYPKLDSIILNAGFQQTLDFTNPQSVSVEAAKSELHTNYLAPVASVAAFLPHLTAVSGPASIYFVTSGLSLVPISRCPNYCASKAALHSFAWTLRDQLSNKQETKHVRVVEIVPPAVQTELHSRQPDLVAAGDANFGVPLKEYTDETWALMRSDEDLDEILIEQMKPTFGNTEDQKRKVFHDMNSMIRKQGKFNSKP